jgi:outer membrane protein, heavy metal efflux system
MSWRISRSLALAASLGIILSLAGCAHYQPAPLSPEQSAAQLQTRSLADAGLRTFLEQNSAGPTEWPLTTWDFHRLTLAAFYYHPSLDVARAQWSVARAGVRTAGGRPNPVLSVAPGYSMNAPSGVSPWFPLMSIDVPIETAGKRGYRIAQAEHLSEAARLNIAGAAWQVRSSLRASLLDYVSARQRSQSLQRLLQTQQQIVALLEERLKAGAVARTELTPFRLALAKANLDYGDAARQAAESRARVAESIGLAARTTDGVEFTLDLAVAAAAGQDLTSDQARQQALLGRPDVLAALAEYAARQSALQLEIAKQYPDLHLSPGYQFDQGEHKWSLGLSIELPVLNRNQGPIGEAQARREEAAARFLALQARVIGELDRALAARAAALEHLERQRQLTELTRSQAASLDALFRAGATDRLEFLAAQLEGITGELALLDAQVKALQALAQLEEGLQRPLEGWPSLEQGRPAPTKEDKP